MEEYPEEKWEIVAGRNLDYMLPDPEIDLLLEKDENKRRTLTYLVSIGINARNELKKEQLLNQIDQEISEIHSRSCSIAEKIKFLGVVDKLDELAETEMKNDEKKEMTEILLKKLFKLCIMHDDSMFWFSANGGFDNQANLSKSSTKVITDVSTDIKKDSGVGQLVKNISDKSSMKMLTSKGKTTSLQPFKKKIFGPSKVQCSVEKGERFAVKQVQQQLRRRSTKYSAVQYLLNGRKNAAIVNYKKSDNRQHILSDKQKTGISGTQFENKQLQSGSKLLKNRDVREQEIHDEEEPMEVDEETALNVESAVQTDAKSVNSKGSPRVVSALDTTAFMDVKGEEPRIVSFNYQKATNDVVKDMSGEKPVELPVEDDDYSFGSSFDESRIVGNKDSDMCSVRTCNKPTIFSFKTPKKSQCVQINKPLIDTSETNKRLQFKFGTNLASTPICKMKKQIQSRAPESSPKQYVCPRYLKQEMSFNARLQNSPSKSLLRKEKILCRDQFIQTSPVLLGNKTPIINEKKDKSTSPNVSTKTVEACKSTNSENNRKFSGIDQDCLESSTFERNSTRETSSNKSHPSSIFFSENERSTYYHEKPSLPMTYHVFKHLQNGGTPRPPSKASNLSGKFSNLASSGSKTFLSTTGNSVFVESKGSKNLCGLSTDLTPPADDTSEFFNSANKNVEPKTPLRNFDKKSLIFRGRKSGIIRDKEKNVEKNIVFSIESHPPTSSKVFLVDATSEDPLNSDTELPIISIEDDERFIPLGEASTSTFKDSRQSSDASSQDNSKLSSKSGENSQAVHVVAAKYKSKVRESILVPPPIIKPGSGDHFSELRKSKRNKVSRLRHWLGEHPVYEFDDSGNAQLVGVSEVRVKEPIFVKHNTANLEDVRSIEKYRADQRARFNKLAKEQKNK